MKNGITMVSTIGNNEFDFAYRGIVQNPNYTSIGFNNVGYII